jgi:hypothetical protein
MQNRNSLLASGAMLALTLAITSQPSSAQSLTDALNSPGPSSPAASPHHAHRAAAAASRAQARRPHHHSAAVAIAAAPVDVPTIALKAAAHEKKKKELALKARAARLAQLRAAAGIAVAADATPKIAYHIVHVKPASTIVVQAPAAASPAPASTPLDVSVTQVSPQQTAPVPTPAAHVQKPKTAQPSLDDMTRDGSVQTADASPADPNSMSVTGAIARFVAALIVVLALVASIIYTLRKKGIGVGAPTAAPSRRSVTPYEYAIDDEPAPAASAPRRPGNWKLAKELNSSATPTPSRLEALSEFEVLGYQILPGTNSTIYKLKTHDRVLLVGCSPEGILSVLTEWDVESSADSEIKFDAVLDEMTSEASAYPFAGVSSVHDTADRLSQTAKRLASMGGASNLRKVAK